ncbi:MAG: GHKL domain-containing protein [Planctomycetes bacterium]|nr:GHKL domain-containing protein [Planctomycetota bacterium]
MSLTGKLILGFLFALVLQVVQMVTSGWFTSQMVDTSETVADALRGNLALQRSLEAVSELKRRIADDQDSHARVDVAVYTVYIDELIDKATQLATMLGDAVDAGAPLLRERAAGVRSQLGELRLAMRHQDDQPRLDALSFLDDALNDYVEALNRAQVGLSRVADHGLTMQRDVKDLPVRAGLLITLAGVVIMAVFVAWFSRQLVIPIERAWAELETRVTQRTAELANTVQALETEIVERQRAEAQKEDLHRQLLDVSRQAGMAELANGVLHNVGNVLNSVNVSSNLLLERLLASQVSGVQKVAALVRHHATDLADFMTSPRGRVLPDYLDQLGDQLLKERDTLLAEVGDLTSCIDHMKEIVHRQQDYARVMGTTCEVRLGDLVEDVLRMHNQSFSRHEIEVVRRFAWDEPCEVDRSRVIQILMNLVKNAKEAVSTREDGDGRIEVALERRGDDVVLSITDNGVGIAATDLTRVFGHGFTTKDEGHGFGLHHSANSATEMGGRLWAESEGPGHGATFLLELPIRPAAEVLA